jgi:hypothetical protein
MIYAALLCVATQTTILRCESPNTHYKINDTTEQSPSFVECLPSTIASSVVGAFTGGLARYLEKKFNIEQSKEPIIILMIMWWIEHKVRHKVVDSLEKDFEGSDIPHKKNWMSLCAWVSSWGSYLYM